MAVSMPKTRPHSRLSTDSVPDLRKDQPKTISDIPDDVLYKIFCLLGYRVLIQECRGVCRQWNRIAQRVPAKIAVPVGIWRSEDLYSSRERFSTESMLNVAERLSWGRVRRYRKALSQQPEQVTVSSFENSEAPLEKRLAVGDDKKADKFMNVVNGLAIITEAFSWLAQEPRTYIKVCELAQDAKNLRAITCIRVSQESGFVLARVQYLVFDDLLIGRFNWNSTTENKVRVVFYQYTTHNILFDSDPAKNVLLPPVLLEKFKSYEFLKMLEVKMVSQGGHFKKVLRLELANPGKREMLSLQYNLDVSPD